LIVHPEMLQIASIMKRVMGHRMHRRPSCNYCTYQLISLAFISGSIVLYASYLCLFLIYCLTHVECFRLFLAANIVAAPTCINFRQRAQYYKQRLWRLCPPYCEREVGFLGHVTHMTGEITRFEASLQLACDLLSTGLRHAHASLRPGFRPGLHLARIMECGL